MTPMRAMTVIMIATLDISSPALAQTVTCITSSQGYRVCDDGHGHKTTEWDRDGMRFGEDSDGNRWTTSRWQDREITTVTPHPER